MSPRYKFYFLWSVFLIPLLSFALSGFIWASDYSNEAVDTISSEHSPQEIATRPNGQHAYGGKVSAYNMIQITNNSTDDFRPSLHNGKIAWFRHAGSDAEIYYWDGSTIHQITDNSTSDEYPSLHNGKIAWERWNGLDIIDPEGWDIYYWNGSTIYQITDDSTDSIYDGHPSLHNGKIAWHRGSYSDSEIYYWDGSTIHQITDDSNYDWGPSFHDGKIAWRVEKSGEYSSEIYYWDGSTIHQITYHLSTYGAYEPSLHDGKIAWEGRKWGDASVEIYYWDGSTIHEITDNSTSDEHPSLHNGKIAWAGWDGSDWEIYYWDGSTVHQITDNSTNDKFPSLHNGMIAWQGWDGVDWEIYYMPVPEGLTGTISGKVTDSSTGEGITGATVSANGFSTATDSDGEYSLSLSPGTYSVTASASGYQSQTKTNITVIAGQTTQVDFALTPESPAPRFLTLPFIDFDIKVQQGWIYTWGETHRGIDYIKGDIDQLPWESFDIVAAADGKAMWSEQYSNGCRYSTFVLIWHTETDSDGNHFLTLYAHLDQVASKIVHRPDRYATDYQDWTPVNRGDFIGKAGFTGTCDAQGDPQPTWIHLHFEVQRGGYAQNKTDPYDIEKTREFYPGGSQYTSCGSNYLWTTDPPSTSTTISTSAKKWRMFSIPFKLNDPSPSSVLQDLGQQDDNLWKVSGWDTNAGGYSKYPDIPDFTPGRAFWLITKDFETIDVGEGTSVDSSSDYPIPLSYSASLNQGWNQIGDPFAFPINLTDVKVRKDPEIVSIQQAQENSWVRNRIWWYNGSEYDFTKNILEPWQGYWVKALTEGCELLIPSFETQESSLHTLPTNGESYLQIIAKVDDLKDSYNFIGSSSSAKDGYDAEDVEEAPPISPYISLFFPHPEWGKNKGDYTQDIRTQISQTDPRQVWNFQVKTDQINQKIILQWENILTFPESLQLYLTDPSENILVNMRKKSSYSFISSSGLESFKVIATSEALPLPEDLDLNDVYGYPNPAHGKGIRFHFHLVSSAKVTIKIYSISGEIVRTLVKDKVYLPGAYEELWKEDNDRGQELARGIYICTIQAANSAKVVRKSAKIVLLD